MSRVTRDQLQRMGRLPLGKLRRVASMSRDEIFYRIGEAARRRADRLRHRLAPGPAHQERLVEELVGGRDAGGGTILGWLQRTAARRFYLPATTAARRRLLRLVLRHGDDEANEAERLCEGKIPLLGLGEVDAGPDIDWHRDPLTGACWEKRFWTDYDLVAGDNPGDPKVVHELNRQQHLPRLAKAWALSGEERFARAALAHMDSWIEQNPEGVGVNWTSSLEIALRAVSWLWTLLLLLPSAALDEARARRILGSLLAQTQHVARYPSLYSSPNTHLLGEAAALYVIGQTLEELPCAAAWKRTGLQRLVAEMQRQTVEGGAHAELSSYYHCYSVDFCLQGLALARRNGTPVPRAAWRTLESKVDFLSHLTRPDGTIPLLGDDDGGRALALARRDYGSFADALSTAAVLFGRGDWKWMAGRLHEETLWLLGPAAAEAWDRLDAKPPATTSRHAPQAGYFVQRSGWARDAAHLVFDCGDLGRLGGGHGHADALSIVWSGPEGDVLIDPGTFVYNGRPEWRDWFRSSRAHNTVVVDGRSQAVTDGTFRWRSALQPRLTEVFSAPGLELIEAELDAGDGDVVHRRRVLQVAADYWVIFDDLRGAGHHDLELLYHFAPSLQPLAVRHRATAGLSRRSRESNGRGRGAPTQGATRSAADLDVQAPGDDLGLAVDVHSDAPGSRFGLTVCGSAPLTTEVVHGAVDPIQGWASRRYGDKQPAPTLRLALRAELPAGFITVLQPRRAGRDEARWREADTAGASSNVGEVRCLQLDGGVGIAIERRDATDYALLSLDGSELQVADLRARGEAFWLRCRGGRIARLLACNADGFERAGRTWLEDRSAAGRTLCLSAATATGTSLPSRGKRVPTGPSRPSLRRPEGPATGPG